MPTNYTIRMYIHPHHHTSKTINLHKHRIVHIVGLYDLQCNNFSLAHLYKVPYHFNIPLLDQYYYLTSNIHLLIWSCLPNKNLLILKDILNSSESDHLLIQLWVLEDCIFLQDTSHIKSKIYFIHHWPFEEFPL